MNLTTTLRRAAALVLAATSVTGLGLAIGEAHPAAAAGADCSVQCISTMTKSSTATSVAVQVSTTTAAKVTYTLRANGADLSKVVEPSATTGLHSKVQFTGLKPFERYRVVARAVDASGKASTKDVYIKTKLAPNISRTALNALFTFSTANPGLATLTVTRPNGSTVKFGEASPRLGHTLNATGLVPGTAYPYRIDFVDSYGRSYVHQGTFSTMHRRLTVTVTKVIVTDDSDTFGAGEMTAAAKLGDQLYWLWNGTKSINDSNSSKTVNLNVTKTYDNASSVVFQAVVRDDDCDAGLCTGGTSPSFSNGSTSDADWSYVKRTFSTTSAVAEPLQSFSLSVDSYVGFTIQGTYAWSLFD